MSHPANAMFHALNRLPKSRPTQAAGLDFTEKTVIGNRLVALSADGDLYEWSKTDGRWVRLEKTTLLYKRTRKRFAGHPLTVVRS